MTEIAHSRLDTSDGPMPIVTAEPDRDAIGAVVVFQEAFGLTTHIVDVCRRLGDAGYRAVAPALFHRSGSPVFAYDDLASVMPVMQTLSADGLAADVATTLAHVEERGFAPARCGVVGFCMGGTVAFLAATQHRLGAAVTFYGGGVSTGRFGLPPLVELAPALRTPWLGLYGDRDRGIPVEDVEALREATAAAPVETEIVRYPDAEHGFHCDDRPAVHAPDAAADAWARTLAWFELHLAGA